MNSNLEIQTKKKENLWKVFLAGGILFVLAGLILFYIPVGKVNTNSEKTQVMAIVNSDSREELYKPVNEIRSIDNYPPNEFFPIGFKPKYDDGFEISAATYAVVDRDSGELLYGKNVLKEYPIASLTKIMTAILAIEKSTLNEIFTVSPGAASVGEATMGLSAGERLNGEELLYGLMLPSGNDAAETLAEGIGIKFAMENNLEVDRVKGRNWFVSEMNRKAQSLGLYDTFFFNPTGLDEESRESSSFSTALDLLALTNYALSNPTFAKIAATRSYQMPFKEGFHKAIYLENILQMDKSFPGIKGVKPGNSVFARETLVSYADLDGRKIIVILLGSRYTKDDVVKIYKRVFGED